MKRRRITGRTTRKIEPRNVDEDLIRSGSLDVPTNGLEEGEKRVYNEGSLRKRL